MYGNAFRPGFDSGLPYRGAGPCCDACAVGDACTGCGPELGAAEGCQTGACPIPGARPMNDSAAGEFFDAVAAYRQARRVGARAAGDVFDDFPELSGGGGHSNLTAEQFARMTQSQREAAWSRLSREQRAAFLGQIGRNSGLSSQEAAEFAARERDADYRLVQGLVSAGAGLVRELAANSSREEIERIRNNARVQAARFGMETNAEGEFLNIFRQSQGLGQGGMGWQNTQPRSGGAGLAVAALVALALMGGGKGRR